MNQQKMNTEACIEDLAEKKELHDPLARLIFEVTGKKLSLGTIFGWINGIKSPGGLNLVRLRVMLSLLGYKVYELESLQPSLKRVAQGIALNIISEDDFESIFGSFCHDHIVKMLCGRSNTMKQKLEEISENMKQKYESILKEALKEVKPRFMELSGSNDLDLNELRRQLTNGKPLGNETAAHSLGHFVNAALPLARMMASKDCAPEMRKRLREIAGRDGVFELKNLLARLCSEDAFREL